MRATLPMPADLHHPGGAVEAARTTFEIRIPSLEGVSSELIVATALGIVLSRYSGQVQIALELRCRQRTLALSLDTAPEQSARALLSTAAATSERAGALRLDSPAQRWPRGAAVTWLEPSAQRASLEGAALNLAVGRDQNVATLVYDSNQFKATTIRRLAGHLCVVLEHLPEHLDAPIASLPLLSVDERQELEALLTGPTLDLGDSLAHQLFEQRARATPDAPALRFREEQLSYRALNARANLLARLLIEKGVKAGSRVMVCLEPSPDIAIALLGILKAGGVYVPLEPSYPAARLQALLADTRPELLLTRAALAERLQLSGPPHLWLDSVPALGAQPEQETDPNVLVTEGQTAYIYYTSGTTGLPKGAMASQSNLRHYLRVAQERYQLGPADVIPAVARFSFSISMFELMLPLTSGGTLLLLEREHVLDPARMARTLSEVTLFHIGPSLLKTLLAYIQNNVQDLSVFSRVRHASSGGDMVPPEVLESLKQIFVNAEVFVIYGCSEISCMGCTYPVSRELPASTSDVGRPFYNTRVRVLDAARNLVPIGVVGELYFSGDGVVQGYLNRAELTEERFVEWEGRRYYRTGDVGRVSEDGWLQLLGRQDFQVQLRGMRIELGEVEHHLRRAPGVKDGVVVARELGDSEKILVGYVVGEQVKGGSFALHKPAIRAYLKEHLPDYMVPSIYVELERLPLNHNLKIDRKALPEPKPEDRRLELVRPASARHEPSTQTEKRLAALWRSLLGLEQVCLEDQFFELGGDSLKAIDLILKVESELGAKLDGLELVRETLGALATLCDQRRGLLRSQQAAPRARVEPVELFHFGQDQSLYGVLHGDADPPPEHIALICAPLGPEAVRAHFVLQRLARRLARAGVPTLRFDYFGQGDSLGESAQATCRRWQEDICAAGAELRQRTGAKQVTLVAARFGATLAAQVLTRLAPQRLVLWDPVYTGAEHVRELSREQEEYLRNVRFRRRWQRAPRSRERVELAGASYRPETVAEMRALKLGAAGRVPAVKWLESARTPERARAFAVFAHDSDGSRLEYTSSDAGWGDIARLEQILPDVGISSALLEMVLE